MIKSSALWTEDVAAPGDGRTPAQIFAACEQVGVLQCKGRNREPIYDFGFVSQSRLTSLRTKGYDPASVGGYEVTMIFRESSVGLPANWTAASVCSSGKRWVMRRRTSNWREKTSRATSSCNVKSDE